MSTGAVPIDVSVAIASSSQNTSGAENTLSYNFNPLFAVGAGSPTQNNTGSPSSSANLAQQPYNYNPATAAVGGSASPGSAAPGSSLVPLTGATSSSLSSSTIWLLIFAAGAVMLLGGKK